MVGVRAARAVPGVMGKATGALCWGASCVSDEELVERMGRGERSALGELFQRHAARLIPIGVSILGSVAEAEDLVHDVFVEAFRHARRFRADRGTVQAWLVVKMRSRSIDRRRAAKQRSTALRGIEEQPSSSEEGGPLDAARSAEYLKLAGAVAELPPEQSEVLMLGYFEELTCSEIGERLGIPLGTVKSRVRRALVTLQSAMVCD